jgi:hypothetical protein
MMAMLVAAQPAMADPTAENWGRWASRADMISNTLEHPGATGDAKREIHTACDGTSAMFMTGGYPRWAAMIQPICASLIAASRGEKKKACHLLPRFVAELKKGEPVAAEARVEPARLRLIAAIALAGC